MLDYSKYENKLKLTKHSVHSEKKELKQLLEKEALTPAQQLRVEELNEIINKFNEDWKNHSEESVRLYYLWKNDLFEEYDVKDNPKVETAFQIAWNYGHAYGYHEVELYFGDLVDLIK